MVATLDVQFTNPTDVGSKASAVQAVVQQAFAEWLRHFDYTTGNYAIRVSFDLPSGPADAYLQYPAPATFQGYGVSTNDVAVGNVGTGTTVYGQRLGLALTGRGAGPADPGTLYLNRGYLNNSRALPGAVAPIERELGHQFGIHALNINNFTFFSGGSAVQIGRRYSLYDASVRFITYPPDYVTTFNGPNAQSAYGGPVPVYGADPSTTAVGGGRAVTTNIEGAASVQPLDVALLRDAGVAALTDQELAEHQVARLYVAAFNRAADSAGLLVQYGGLRAGLTLFQLGDGIVSSQEFASRYGKLSDADFVEALYRNALGRASDASGAAFYQGALARGLSRGTLLAAFADSDEERGRLNAAPNLAYAATAEAQVARLYDTAFGRTPDPTGFTPNVNALFSGATLQQVALSFLGADEFAARYGASPSDRQLVDALYANALHRAPDAAEESLYVRALGAGLSRADVVAGFSDSQEHIALLAQAASAQNARGFSSLLLPGLGTIPVVTVPTTA